MSFQTWRNCSWIKRSANKRRPQLRSIVRQSDGKMRAFARCGVDCNRAAVAVNHLLDIGKAKAGTGPLIGIARTKAGKGMFDTLRR